MCIADLLSTLASACREPMSVERFVPGDGPYTFLVDLGDTTAAYDFDLYTRVDADPESIRDLGELPLEMTWKAPSDSLYRETVYMPLQGRSSFFSRQVLVPYRADVRPYEAGAWALTAAIPDTAALPGLRGLGLVVTKHR